MCDTVARQNRKCDIGLTMILFKIYCKIYLSLLYSMQRCHENDDNGGACVPPAVNCLQYLATGSTLTAVGLFQLPAPQSGTLTRISSGTRPSVQTVLDVCLKTYLLARY